MSVIEDIAVAIRKEKAARCGDQQVIAFVSPELWHSMARDCGAEAKFDLLGAPVISDLGCPSWHVQRMSLEMYEQALKIDAENMLMRAKVKRDGFAAACDELDAAHDAAIEEPPRAFRAGDEPRVKHAGNVMVVPSGWPSVPRYVDYKLSIDTWKLSPDAKPLLTHDDVANLINPIVDAIGKLVVRGHGDLTGVVVLCGSEAYYALKPLTVSGKLGGYDVPIRWNGNPGKCWRIVDLAGMEREHVSKLHSLQAESRRKEREQVVLDMDWD